MTVSINMRQLLEAGVHYGHQVRRWNPKMAPYIFGSRNGVHIIDLQKTVKLFQKACNFIEGVTAKGGHVLFVGTKRMARELVAEQAGRSGQYFVNHRWLGGTMTNLSTMRQSIHTLKRIDKMSTDGTFDKLPKKEVLKLNREKDKLERNLGGIKNMPGLPSALFIVDAHRESIALQEARRLGIPVVAITDTNADPSEVDYLIPGNDDSIKSLKLFISTVAEACVQGKSRAKDKGEDLKSETVEEGSFYDDQGHAVSVERAKKFEDKGENQGTEDSAPPAEPNPGDQGNSQN